MTSVDPVPRKSVAVRLQNEYAIGATVKGANGRNVSAAVDLARPGAVRALPPEVDDNAPAQRLLPGTIPTLTTIIPTMMGLAERFAKGRCCFPLVRGVCLHESHSESHVTPLFCDQIAHTLQAQATPHVPVVADNTRYNFCQPPL
jgi:hypothetical protein